jgi:hypothetical protein
MLAKLQGLCQGVKKEEASEETGLFRSNQEDDTKFDVKNVCN